VYLAKNLKHLRLKSGLSQEYLAKRFGYKSYTTIQKWESGAAEPPLHVLEDLSKLYGYTMHELYTEDLTSEAPSNRCWRRVPLVGTIAAETPILAEENIIDYFTIDSRVKADFALRVKGDSMVGAGIVSGDIAFFKKQETLENGEIGAILSENEVTLKRFYREGGTVILQSENDHHKPIILTNGVVRILGKLVAVLNIRSRERGVRG
jgi:repressor LexA